MIRFIARVLHSSRILLRECANNGIEGSKAESEALLVSRTPILPSRWLVSTMTTTIRDRYNSVWHQGMCLSFSDRDRKNKELKN